MELNARQVTLIHLYCRFLKMAVRRGRDGTGHFLLFTNLHPSTGPFPVEGLRFRTHLTKVKHV